MPLGVGEEVSALDPGRRGRRRGPRQIRAGEGAGEGAGGGGRGACGVTEGAMCGVTEGAVCGFYFQEKNLVSVVDLALGKGFFYFFFFSFFQKKDFIFLCRVLQI